ncbi:hypothetical protein KP509_22G002400 [Ceratopteris richardii]|uniref:Uncharacterized protein n=1 Tax=Ceratopteris richardii TaxID=49495 RepID=A0A8T2S302_CERRI|nr:hypothetical protein KP509_22G002400 [Ceratopteris richardii]
MICYHSSLWRFLSMYMYSPCIDLRCCSKKLADLFTFAYQSVTAHSHSQASMEGNSIL